MAIKASCRRENAPLARYNAGMAWVYLSPHLDDAALSCGGLAWEQAQAGEAVSIWTICAGEPPPGELSLFARQLHARWQAGQNAPAIRRMEDSESCRRIGASYRHFSIPDCIYRRHPQTGEFMYASEASLNGPLHPGDMQLVHALGDELQRCLPVEAIFACPLAFGNHVDHQLTCLAAEDYPRNTWYYADFPYVLRSHPQLEQLRLQGWKSRLYPISRGGLLAWQESIAAHASQNSTFWPGEPEMRRAVSDYLAEAGGIRLWRQPGR